MSNVQCLMMNGECGIVGVGKGASSTCHLVEGEGAMSQGGEEIVVTERGRSVARIVPSQSPSIKNFDKFFIIRYCHHESLAS